jgi:CobQ-like glutamine amidotransferase family enzyme
MHGSFLPKNPDMADYLIQTALRGRTGEDIILPPIGNEFEENARKHIKAGMAGTKARR